MLYGLFVTLFVTIALLLIMIILIQQAKGSIGLGSIGGGTQMLFGGSGGQDLFQQTTWVLGILFMVISLVLSVVRSTQIGSSRFIKTTGVQQQTPIQQ